MKGREIDDAEQRLVDLVKLDYDATQRALAGFVTSGGQLRAVGIAAWGVVFAASLQVHSEAIAIMAGLLSIAFAVIDGYHATLYRQTLARARNLEALLGEYSRSLGISAGVERKVTLARAKLEQHSFGVHSHMAPINKARLWWLPRPLRVTWIYVVLILAAAVAAVVFASATHSNTKGEHRQRVAVRRVVAALDGQSGTSRAWALDRRVHSTGVHTSAAGGVRERLLLTRPRRVRQHARRERGLPDTETATQR